MHHRIRELREMSGISQFGLARLCGVGRTRLSLAENGHVQLRPEECVAIETAMAAVIRQRATRLQKAAILDLLLMYRGRWVPAYSLSAVVLQHSARVKELRDAGYVIENKTERVCRQGRGPFRLLACPEEDQKPRACEEPRPGGATCAERRGE
jgi:transcriptional regulator with XRE-family HTH domain